MTGETRLVTPKLLVGVFLTLLGLLLTAERLGMIDAFPYLRFWSILLIGIGVLRIGRGQQTSGWILIVAGAWILAYNTGVFPYEITDFWPLILIALGAILVLQATRGEPEQRPDSSSVGVIGVLSGPVRRVSTDDFRGGWAAGLLGGSVVDLTQARIRGRAVMNVYAFWGGVEIIVPRNWSVIGNVMPVMGGFEDHTRPTRDNDQQLIIRGCAVMAGIEVKNPPETEGEER